MQGLDRLLEDRLLARSPLLQQPACDAHNRVGGPVAVGEDARVEQVDAEGAPLVGQVDKSDLGGERFGDPLQDRRDQVGVRVDHDDGVQVAAGRFLAQLVRDDVEHQGRQGFGETDVMAFQVTATYMSAKRRSQLSALTGVLNSFNTVGVQRSPGAVVTFAADHWDERGDARLLVRPADALGVVRVRTADLSVQT